jgi:formate-dependent nitrite reductase membrane component NrfD
VILADAQHFVRGPDWTWYILFYFFLAGLSGGSYTIATLLRLGRNPADEPAARLGHYVAFVAYVICPVLLTLDLGQPLRFWHMVVNTTPGEVGPAFKYWSPMSVGAWALLIFGVFVTVSFVDALARDGKIRMRWLARLLGGSLGTLWNIIGAVFGTFVAGYTGVLLAVSNQPVWSDTWALGGLFLASGLAGSAALLGWLVHVRKDARGSAAAFSRLERFFPLLELVLIVVFAALLILPGTLSQAFGYPWYVLWAVALVGLLPGLSGAASPRVTASGGVAVRSTFLVGMLSIVALLGVLALRAAIIFSAQ